jgi:hypothetical protein
MNGAKLIIAAAAIWAWCSSAIAATVSPQDASRHIGETATVCGVVASAKFAPRSRAQPTFLDLGAPYPNEPFTAVIWGTDRAKFIIPRSGVQIPLPLPIKPLIRK